MRRHLAACGVLAAALSGCSEPGTPSPSPAATPAQTSGMPSSAAPPAPVPAGSQPASTPTSAPPTVPPSPPTSTTITLSAADVQRYLAAARAAFPQRDDAALAQLATTTCTQLKANPSAHDVVGDLAGQLGSQATAKQLVDAAVAAYCPGVAPNT